VLALILYSNNISLIKFIKKKKKKKKKKKTRKKKKKKKKKKNAMKPIINLNI